MTQNHLLLMDNKSSLALASNSVYMFINIYKYTSIESRDRGRHTDIVKVQSGGGGGGGVRKSVVLHDAKWRLEPVSLQTGCLMEMTLGFYSGPKTDVCVLNHSSLKWFKNFRHRN